jgi:hypothetical protein
VGTNGEGGGFHASQTEEQQSSARKGDPIRNAGISFMQAPDPLLVRQNIQNWPISKPEYQKRQHAAEQARDKRIFTEMIEAKPYRCRGRELCVTSADPAACEQSEANDQYQSSQDAGRFPLWSVRSRWPER